MKTYRRGTGIVIGLAVGLLTGALSVTRAHADQGMVQKTSPTSAERMTSETFVVSGIDRGKRTVTMTNAEGERNTMNVPADVKAYETLKVGDRVDVDYRESIGLSMAPGRDEARHGREVGRIADGRERPGYGRSRNADHRRGRLGRRRQQQGDPQGTEG